MISKLPRLASTLALIALIGVLPLLFNDTIQATGPGCTTSGPVSGAYSLDLCLTNPADGATLSDVATVSATATVSGTNPGVQKMIFYLDGAYLLIDFQSPHTFSLPTSDFVDGAKLIEVETIMRDGFVSARASVSVTFNNGVTEPPVNSNSFTPATGTTPPPGQSFVLAAVGDGAGGMTSSTQVTNLIGSWNPNMLLYLGDVYEKGTSTEFYNWYGTDETFYGRFRAVTNPAIGNHEYENNQAPGYFDYWDNVPSYYSFNVAGWHMISLNSTNQLGQTEPGSPQYEWLAQDLAANTAACTLVFYHHPLFNVGEEGVSQRMEDIWSLMAAHGVDLALTGHDHSYQRWVPLNGAGAEDPAGITQFVAGGGGHGIQQFITSDSRMAKGIDMPGSFGALRLELNAQGTTYQFINVQGNVADSGAIACNGAPQDTTPPTPPVVTASAVGSHEVGLSWTPSTDNTGIATYDIYRNGSILDTISPETSYADVTVASEVTYSYQVRARDLAGNVSPFSNTSTVTPPPGQAGIFTDDFETGDLSKWNIVTGLSAQQQQVFSGSWAARGTSTGAATYAYKYLSPAQASLYYRIRFKLMGSQNGTVNLMKFRTSTGTSLIGLYVGNNGKLGYRNDIAGVSSNSSTTVSSGIWHTVQLHVVINGSNSQTETWFDDTKINALSKTESLGTAPIGRLQLGENSTGRTYDIAFDTVVADPNFIVTDTTPPSVPAGFTANATSSTQVDLSWQPSTDNVAVTGYTVYRDGAPFLGLPVGTVSYADTTALPYTDYTYSVDAFDGAGNHSAQSNSASASTPSDTTPPSTPTGLIQTGISDNEVDIGWQPSTDNVAVAGYKVYRDGEVLGEVDGAILNYADTTASPSNTYSYTVSAFDGPRNLSPQSTPLSASTGPDLAPPSVPLNLAATPTGATEIQLTWSPSSDNFGVTGYTVYRDGLILTTVAGSLSSFLDTVEPVSSHTYNVDAFDAAGNHSAQSDPASATTSGDNAPPTVPTGLTATAVSLTEIHVTWSASTDNVAVDGYTLYRNGSFLAVLGSATLTYTDTGLAASTSYTYTVDAFDVQDNYSAASAPVTATTPIFVDGFETGNLSQWSTNSGLLAQQQQVYSGSWAARGTSTGIATYAYKTLPSAQNSLYYQVRFKLVSYSTNVNLLKVRTASNASLLGVYVSSTGKLAYRNDVTGISTSSQTTVSTGVWHTLQSHVVINGTSSQTETWLDGVKINALSLTESLGTTPIGRVQLGENSAGRNYDVAFDTVTVSTALIAP